MSDEPCPRCGHRNAPALFPMCRSCGLDYEAAREPVTAEQFEGRWGRAPAEGDLDRVNCHRGGEVGHFACGVCPRCGRPRSECFWLHGEMP